MKPKTKRVPTKSAELITKLAPQAVPAVCNTHFMLTNKGLMDCLVAKFEPSNYQGLGKNCGRTPRKVKPQPTE